MITEEKKKNCLKSMTRDVKFLQKNSKREQLSINSLRMLLHITNVDKEHDDDNDDDDDDDANAHNLINAGKKRKILFFIIRTDLRINIPLDDDFKQSSQDTQDCKRRNVISQVNPETHHPPTCN